MSVHPPISHELALRLERAHERFSAAMYGGEPEELANALLATNRSIAEPEWNHGWALPPEPSAWPRALREIASRLDGLGRRAAVAGTTVGSPDLLARLYELGWSEVFRFSLLLIPRGEGDAGAAWPGGATIHEVGRSELGEFAALFESSFYAESHLERPPGYESGFARGLERPSAGIAVEHTLVRLDGVPAAIGTLVQGDRIAGLYNVGVARPFRGRGLSSALKAHRIARARSAGARVVYECTEDPAVEARELRRGFVRAFELVGYAADEASQSH